MANRTEASDVENQAKGSVTGHREPTITKSLDALIKGMRDEKGKLLPMWSNMFVMLCVLAVSLDPLFFYILIIDQDNKCLQMDKKLRTVVLVLRSLTDIIFAVPFIYKVHRSGKFQMHKKLAANVAAHTTRTVLFIYKIGVQCQKLKMLRANVAADTMRNLDWKSKGRVLIEVGKKIAKRLLLLYSLPTAKRLLLLYSSFVNDFLALLPVPQLLIVFTFYHMRSAGYVEHRKVMNIFIVGQYLPRIYRIYQSSKELRENAGIWVKGLLYFLLYMIASHILGAFWYFFSIQQETLCWHNACAKHSPDPIGCMNAFYCGRQTTTSRNITFLNKHCPLDTPDGVLPPFNFGIFFDSLKNHNPEHIKFEKKFFYSFWWGLRNLSNFGTNLTTSTYVLENLFAILISVLGMLLFLYLIGNVQTFIQLEATKNVEKRQRMMGGEVYRKRENIKNWIYANDFPDDIKNDILKSVDKALENGKDADVENPFLILSLNTKEAVKRHLFTEKLRTVEELKDMDDYVLMSICHYLKPVTYIENNFVFKMGDPLNCMLFIMEGTMWTYASSDSNAGQGMSSTAIKFQPLRRGDFYGEELLKWASDPFTEVPVSSKNVKSQTKVKAFVLMVEDLETLVSTKVIKDARRKSDDGLGPNV